MNRTITTLILVSSATLGVTSLNAEDKAVANIPFAFRLNAGTMPAGKYQIERPVTGDPYLFSFSDAKGHSRFVGAPAEGKADPSNPKLTFVCIQGECSLATIQAPGSSVSYSVKLPTNTHSVGMSSMIAVRITN